jgi:DNA (cytosine-5)-methyltransferase 1
MTYFLDLFAGIGGFSLGAHWAGMRFDRHFYSEVDDYACKVYAARFPESEALGDICKIRGSDLPTGDWIIAGGFPCQDISVAGKGAGLAGERSGLWYEYARIIGELRPRYAIMENVGALAFRGLDSVLGSLAALGYDAEWQDIRASDVGAPHRRERIWIVAYPNEDGLDKPYRNIRGMEREECTEESRESEPSGITEALAICRKLADAPQHGCGQGRARRPNPIGEGQPEQPLQALADTASLYAQGYSDRSWQRESRGGGWWATEPDVGRVAHGIPSRVDRLKCLGNSIVPQIAELIFRGIK